MVENRCVWGECGKPAAYRLCREHYLLKESLYGEYDLYASESEWNGGNGTDRQCFKDWGLERVRAYTDYMYDKLVNGDRDE